MTTLIARSQGLLACCGSPKRHRAQSTRVSDVSRSGYAEPTVTRMIDVVRLLIVLTGRHRTLALDIVALRQQLALYRRTRPKPMMVGPIAWSGRGYELPGWTGNRPWWSSDPPRLWRGIAWYWIRRSRPRGGARGPAPRSDAWSGRWRRELTLGRASDPWGEAGVRGL
jgi:hypothetical protein